MEKRVVVYKTVDPIEAKMIRIVLSDANVESVIYNEETLDITGPSWNTFAPLIIEVLASQKEQANIVLEKYLEDKQRAKLKDATYDPNHKDANNFLKWLLIASFGLVIYFAFHNPYMEGKSYFTTEFSKANDVYHPYEENKYIVPVLTLFFLCLLFVGAKTIFYEQSMEKKHNAKATQLFNENTTDEDLTQLKNLNYITRLSLPDAKISDRGLAHLGSLANLTTLDLSETEIGDAGLVHLEFLNNLTTLDLSNTKVSDAGLAHLEFFNNLLVLYLSETQISDAGLIHIKPLSSLTKLDLSNTKIGAGLIYLKSLVNLTYLDLSDTKTNDAGLVHLKFLINLTNLDLNNTMVTKRGVEQLKKTLTKCSIST